MRDFRDAKAMAHSLRAALAAKGFKITNSQSLELIAGAFGAADWNTLSAAIRADASRPDKNPPPPVVESPLGPRPSPELELTLRRAFDSATQRKHRYTTLEHLLLSLIDDTEASIVIQACKADFGVLRGNLTNYLDNGLKRLETGDGSATGPTPAFQRVIQRAVIHVQGSGGHAVTGGQLLLAIFPETRSPAARLLAEQGITRQDAVSFIAHGIVGREGGTA